MQLACLFFYLCLEQRIPPSQLATVKLTCAYELHKYESVNLTYGVSVYTFAFMGAMIGAWLNPEHS